MVSERDVVIRLLIAAALGGLVGLERELRDQPAGLRTHILVGVGSCLFALVSAFGFGMFTHASSQFAARVDVTRISSQIVVGIGFLGGGTILRHGMTVKGLTTAASLWVTAAVGLAVAMGFYWGAGTATLLSVVSLAALKPIELRFMKRRRAEAAADPENSIQPD